MLHVFAAFPRFSRTIPRREIEQGFRRRLARHDLLTRGQQISEALRHGCLRRLRFVSEHSRRRRHNGVRTGPLVAATAAATSGWAWPIASGRFPDGAASEDVRASSHRSLERRTSTAAIAGVNQRQLCQPNFFDVGATERWGSELPAHACSPGRTQRHCIVARPRS
jgi:hypothetical protein